MPLTKEKLIAEIEKFGCGLIADLPLRTMTKEQIVVHLEHCNCPKLKQLREKAKEGKI